MPRADWEGGSHRPRTHLALQPAQLVAQAVVHLHQLLHFGLGGGQSLLHLQVLLQRDGAVREVGGVHALWGEGISAAIPEPERGAGVRGRGPVLTLARLLREALRSSSWSVSSSEATLS